LDKQRDELLIEETVSGRQTVQRVWREILPRHSCLEKKVSRQSEVTTFQGEVQEAVTILILRDAPIALTEPSQEVNVLLVTLADGVMDGEEAMSVDLDGARGEDIGQRQCL
jgi:hypothetical protein